MAPRSVCVYCSSSTSIDPHFVTAARDLGRLLAAGGHQLVYGGASVGTMGELARAAQAGGGRVVGVIPSTMVDREIAFEDADELIVTRDLRERKAIMEERADAFVALPGGFGTLEELLEVLTLRLLGLHTKPIVIVNVDGFYDALLSLFDELIAARFARPESITAFQVAGDAQRAMRLLGRMTEEPPDALPAKWL